MRFPVLVKNIASIAVVGAVLTGCSSFSPKNSYEGDPRSSVALNVVNASGINQSKTLKDVSQEKLRESVKGRSDSTLGLDVASAGLFATGTATALPGFSSLGSAGLMLVPALLPSKAEVYEVDSFVIWMPKEPTMTKNDARLKLTSLLKQQVVNNYPEKDDISLFYKPSSYEFNKNKKNITERSVSIIVNDPVEAKAPDWLGGYEAYSWGVGKSDTSFNSDGKAWLRITGCNYNLAYFNENQTQARECMLSFTKGLPEWIYLYVARKDAFFVDQINSGMSYGSKYKTGIKGAEYPVVFNQGKAHFFIEPAQVGQTATFES